MRVLFCVISPVSLVAWVPIYFVGKFIVLFTMGVY